MELFQAILDYQIEERQNEIRALSESVPEQLQLIATGPEEVRLELSEANKKQIERLKMEIDDLRVQKESLKDERPFIWSIEFSEAFFERGGFDVIIGNPPYLRQAAIRDPIAGSPQASTKTPCEKWLDMIFQNTLRSHWSVWINSALIGSLTHNQIYIPIFIYAHYACLTAKVYTSLFVQTPG